VINLTPPAHGKDKHGTGPRTKRQRKARERRAAEEAQQQGK
jgi:hypothetical protein